MSDLTGRLAQLSEAQRTLLDLRLAAKGNRAEPIAVVGMACRFPEAEGLEAYWRLLCDGVDAISEVPRQRWDVDALYDPDPQAPGRMNTRWGGFVRGIDRFDASFFGISPREAARMDPQQRLLLEVAWEALENAGLVPRRLAGSATGVFVGIFMDDYRRLQLRERPDAYTGTGSTFCIAANRISYQLDLRGPSMAIDTACSSSLVAVHLACQSLASGESSLALAGGVNLLLTPEPTIEMSKAGLMAADGRCKTFDARADGYVRGEGAGVVVLKPLAKAQADGDFIYAIIRATAVNQDGRTNGLTSPNRFAQEAVLRDAYRRAGVAPSEIDYVEAHGTGTALGDSMECRALGTVFGEGRPTSRPLAVGSVKTNFGHLETAAGVAGLIKVALALSRREIPASLHCEQPNPEIPFAELRLAVQRRRTPWPRSEGRSALAGLSSFGFGGTNAHAVLEEAPAPSPAVRQGTERPLHVLALSARDELALRDLAGRFRERLSAPDGDPVEDLCFSANTGRTPFERRLAAFGETREALAGQLGAFLGEAEGSRPVAGSGTWRERPKIAFLFSGQGAQYAGMARELFATQPAFRRTLLGCQEILAPYLAKPLASVLLGEPGTEGLIDDTAYTQPLLFALEYALAELWKTWGVVPDALLGHSVGEIAAACVAGVLSLEDGLKLIALRARLMAGLPRDGAMAALFAGEREVESALAPLAGEATIAAVNGPLNTVISGRRAAVEAVAARFREQGVKVESLHVSHAFHSALMDPILGRLEEEARRLRHAPPRSPLVSNVTGGVFGNGAAAGPDAGYWALQARQPVRFLAGMETLRQAGCQVFVEIGPGTTLLGMGAKMWGDAPALWLPSLRKGSGDWERILRTLGTLFAEGIDPDWSGFDREAARTRRKLPSYPFQRQRFWHGPTAAEIGALPAARPTPAAPAGPRLVRADSLAGDPALATGVERLVAGHGLGSGSISQVTGKTHLFVGSRGDAFFYLAHAGSSIAAMDYTGPEEAYEPLLRELMAFAAARGLAPALLEETPERLDRLDRLGFSATRIGVWQDIEDLASFQLAGGAMRRLRYLVQRYEAQGRCETVEHTPGSDPVVDREIAAVMEEWAAARGVTPAFLAHMKKLVFSGAASTARHRTFLVRRNGVLDGVIFILPAPALARRRAPAGATSATVPGGYLMDVECYRPDAPLGCLELGITRIIRALQEEGATVLSLGLTPGALLAEHPGDDPEARSLFAKLHDEGLLNGDANFQFKTKFRPRTVPSFLCRLRDADPERLMDIIHLLADPFSSGGLDALADAAPPDAGVETGRFHPLVHRRLDLAIPGRIYESSLGLRTLPYLGDHRVEGIALLPAAGLMEMALAASGGTAERVRIAELSIVRALVLPESGERSVQITVDPGPGAETLKIFCRTDRGEPWGLTATATTLEAADGPPEAADLAEIRRRCPAEMSGPDLYASLERSGYEYGASFRAVKSLWLGDGEVLGRVEDPGSRGGTEDGGIFSVPLLDASFHLAWPLLSRAAGEGGGPLLPVGLEGFRLFRRPGPSVWVHSRLLAGTAGGPSRLALRLLDDAGGLIAECAGLLLERAGAGLARPEDASSCLYEVTWHQPPLSSLAGTGPAPQASHWLVLADRMGVADAVAARLAGEGARCTLVRRGGGDRQLAPDLWEVEPSSSESWTRVLAAAEPELPLRVLHLWALDSSVDELEDGSPDAAETDLQWLVGSLPALVQGISAAAREGACRIWLATSGAQIVLPSAASAPPVAVLQASLWGIGRVLAREHPDLWGGLLDLRLSGPEQTADALLAEVFRAGGDKGQEGNSGAAVTAGRRYVPLLVRRPPAPPQASLANWQPDPAGTHLITGGLGALGLLVAERLVERGARYIALLGRHGPPEGGSAAERIGKLRAAGAEVRALRADVADRGQLAAALSEISSALPPLCGAVHAAGILDDGVLLQQSWARVRRVLAPKVLGALHLHQLTRGTELRYFALFSSASALLGTPGQAGYAAGNAFLSALAHERRRQGLPALCLGWGPWAGGGMAGTQDPRTRELWRAQGVAELAPEVGLAALELALAADATEVLVMSLDARRLAGAAMGREPLFSGLVAGAPPDSAESRTDGKGGLRNEHLAAGGEPERLTTYLRGLVAGSLHLDPAALDVDRRLNQLGMDSLTVMELRNRLKSDLRLDLPAVALFEYPTVRQLTDLVATRLDAKQAPAAAPPPLPAPPVQVDQLSDDEVEAMLQRLLLEEGR